MTRYPLPTHSLKVSVFSDRAAMGLAAALDIASEMRHRLARQSEVRIIFACAPSQQEMLSELTRQPHIAWQKITAFHMDEYIGLPEQAPQRFGQWLRHALCDHVPLRKTHFLMPGGDLQACVADYEQLLAQAPIDIVCLGIGNNGHLAFNDPPQADILDTENLRIVTLEESCRQQQVDDGCFDTLAAVPQRALTLTVPRLLNSSALFCVAPGAAKRQAVQAALRGPIGNACPASALRLHPRCSMYLDHQSDPDCPENATL